MLGLLLAAGLRAVCAPPPADPGALAAWAARTPPPLPSLAEDGVERLAWLPGVGAGRAQRIVAARPYLGRALEPGLLPRLHGVGERTAEEVEAWFDAQREEGDGAALE